MGTGELEHVNSETKHSSSQQKTLSVPVVYSNYRGSFNQGISPSPNILPRLLIVPV